MPFPTQNAAVVSSGLSKFTSRYSAELAPKLQALAAVYLGEVQALENAIFATIEAKWLANAVGVDLDIIGALVGQPRETTDDNVYRATIRMRIKANRSQGRAEDVIQLALLVAQKLTSDLNGKVTYREAGTMAFEVTLTNLLYPSIVQSLLSETRAATSRGGLVYSVWPDGNDFSYTSVYSSAAGQAGYGSVYDPTVGGLQLSEFAL